MSSDRTRPSWAAFDPDDIPGNLGHGPVGLPIPGRLQRLGSAWAGVDPLDAGVSPPTERGTEPRGAPCARMHTPAHAHARPDAHGEAPGGYGKETPHAGVWRHKKTGGLYVVLFACVIEADWSPGLVYQNVNGGPLIVRPTDQFLDGRFTPVRVAE